MNIMETNSAMLAIFTTSHVIIILVVVLILFGGRKLPEFAKGLAKGLRIFKDELHSVKHDLEEEPTTPAATKKEDVTLHDTLPSQQPVQEPKK